MFTDNTIHKINKNNPAEMDRNGHNIQSGFITFPKQVLIFTCTQYKSLENTMGKGEIARNEQFLLFPLCFLPIWRTFRQFHQTWNCRLKTLIWKVLNFVVRERVKKFFARRHKENSYFCHIIFRDLHSFVDIFNTSILHTQRNKCKIDKSRLRVKLVRLSVRLFVRPYASVLVCVPAVSVCLCVCVSITALSVYLSVLLVCLSCLAVDLPVYPSLRPCMCLSLSLCLCLFIFVSISDMQCKP